MNRSCWVLVIAAAGCASHPPPVGLVPSERPARAWGEVKAPAAGSVALERIVVDVPTGRDGVDGLATSLAWLVGPGTWGPESGTDLHADGEAILVKHSAAAREAIRGVLSAMKAPAWRVATLTATPLELDPDQVAGLDRAAPAVGGLADVYDREKLHAALRTWRNDGAVELQPAELTLGPGFAGWASVSTQRGSTLKGGGVTDSGIPYGRAAKTPVQSSRFKAVILPNGAGSADSLVRFELDVAATFGTGGDPISIARADNGDRTTELPNLKDGRLAGVLVLRPGQSILAFGAEPRSTDGKPRILAVVIDVDWGK